MSTITKSLTEEAEQRIVQMVHEALAKVHAVSLEFDRPFAYKSQVSDLVRRLSVRSGAPLALSSFLAANGPYTNPATSSELMLLAKDEALGTLVQLAIACAPQPPEEQE